MTTPLAPYACLPEQSRGRFHAELGGERRGPRDIFQRDRDRIIHSIAFRRLRHKTQVFMAPDGDHYRVRLTHSLEVAQIGRTIARALGLNEDLTEALCLAHDIGHPPFGHAGEHALEAAMAAAGGFDHNAHCLRVLMLLESPYPRFPGLNLSWDMLEGLAKHNGPVFALPGKVDAGFPSGSATNKKASPTWAMAELDALYPLELHSWPSLEAQVAAIADDIAYDNHDIDDGLRAGMLSLEQICAVPLVREGWNAVRARYPENAEQRLLGELIRDQIGLMVNDVIETSRAAIDGAGVRSVADVRACGKRLIRFSDALAREEKALSRFMYDNLYMHESQLVEAAQAKAIVSGLFAAYQADPSLMGERWQESMIVAEPQRSRHIGDYIAGMTDRYAERQYELIHGNLAKPD
ncbi:MAG: deoxyguanosinetriphosphate triphosphohydrolase [Sphingobium sp.]|nr:deoxyguanosinetriphosphate triphosphohydrolase [Sphingobium sp.]MBP6111908.1 deoxyguanosinetriphosphate triphosphohydrolase [Sphingobium sp.]MBP8670349.1 deoxyguanosinetriphosphate triphosphohydrolase [Sphingobium sp.]MBP9157689.1 deoxyguanosinetriphosphate triphosphohydrolase [Sphingobium sp.]MCC6482856.1 deoxyguanosinetriphosphate triphosphohydrolase [Sphingomonadaceae bacterium]